MVKNIRINYRIAAESNILPLRALQKGNKKTLTPESGAAIVVAGYCTLGEYTSGNVIVTHLLHPVMTQ